MTASNHFHQQNALTQSPDETISIAQKVRLLTSSRLMVWLTSLVCLFMVTSAVRADRVPANCNGSGLGISLFTSIPDVHVGDTLFYSINVFNGAAGSGRIACDATGIQAFIVTPDGLTNNITLRRTTLRQGESDFYLDVVRYVVRAQDIQPDGTLLATARDIGVIHQNDTDSSGGGFQGVNTEVNLPCVLISAICFGGVGENGQITFTGTVTNCGNNTLVGVTVTNFHDGGNFTVLFPTNLARGQAATFSGSYVPFNACLPNTAVLTVRATDEFTSTPRTVTNFTTITCQNTVTPGIRVTKSCPTEPVAPGQLVTFSGTVSNTGNVTLTNIVVVNNQPAANTTVFTLASLAPGAVANFTASYTAPTNCGVSDTLNATATSRCGVAVSSSATANCPILTTPLITVTAACPTTPILPGGSITYTGTVRNNGNITLTNIVVISDQPAANTTVFTIATLAPGAFANFTSSATVPANACSVSATFIGTAKSVCTSGEIHPAGGIQVAHTGQGVTNTVTTTCPVTTAPAIAVTLACPASAASTGGTITYTGTVRNSGTVTLNNVFVVNNQPAANSPVIGPITLAPGATVNFTTSFIAPSNACSVSSMVTAIGADNCGGNRVTNSASATCTLLTTPNMVVRLACPVTPGVPGGLVNYTGTVRNSGDITLTNVVVINNQSGTTPVFTSATLAPGAIASFSGSYLAPTNCSSSSTATATARSICGVAITNSVTASCPIQTTPQIAVTAACPTTPVLPGGTVTYTGTVRNTGNIPLTNVTVVSDRPVANTTVFSVATLAPGASANFTSTATLPTNACTITTTFSGIGRDLCTTAMVTNTVSTTCTAVTAPAIAVTLACPPTATLAGGTMFLDGTVRNSGNVTLTNVFVGDASNPTIGPITLAPGATFNFFYSFTTPADACTVTRMVTARGADNCSGNMVTNTASATCTLITTPNIVVTQVCPVSPTTPGGLVNYSGTVRNSGNITLTNIVVVNNLSGTTPVFTTTSLAPGAIANFTGSFRAPTNCIVTSIATATGRSICGVSVTNSVSSTCPILTTPAIVVTQTCPTTPVLPGSILTYSGTVSNSGNTVLTNIVVVNNMPASNTVVFTLASLAPGATANFTGSYVTPDDCCVVSSTVRASGQGCDGRTATDTATRTCTVLSLPRIVVTKTCVAGILRPGDLMTYSGTVSNAGNVPLINVLVSNNQPSNNSPVLGPITLAPGESVPYYASYIVPADFCGTDTVTASGLDVCTFLPVTHSVTATCPVTTAPRISVIKNCPVVPPALGGLYTFTGTVSNSGNVTLINVFVVDNQPTNNTPVIGPLTLAPGASANFSGSYIAPTDCCEVIDTVTARGQDRCSGTNVTATSTTFCRLLTRPAIAVDQTCPPDSMPIGSVFTFTGSVTNTGDVVLTNVFVRSSQPNNTRLLGPIELAPGESEGFSGTYTIMGGTNTTIVTNRSTTVTTNTTTVVVTNNTGTVTTNTTTTVTTNGATPTSFGTINSISQATVDRFGVPSGLNGLTYAGEDHGYAATQFYSTRKDTNGTSFFDTITASTGTTTDRFNATTRNFDALTYAAPDLGYGPLQFYYLSRDNAGVSTFGTITPGGVVGVTTDRFVVGSNFDALTFSATDVGYGANLFYYVRHDASGLSTFGTINPALPGTITDRFTVGTNVHALVFTDLAAPGFGPNNFYYLRRGADGVSTFGTIFVTGLTTATVTDRFTVGTNATELTFTATDAGSFGPNLFYYLRGGAGTVVTNTTTTFTTNTTPTFTTNTTTTFTTNTTTTFTTNSVVFTIPNIVTATGVDICEARTVTATARCSGSGSGQTAPVIGGNGAAPSTYRNGTFTLSFATQNGQVYMLQYKNSIMDATWTDLQSVTGDGGFMSISDATGGRMRFYRLVLRP